MELKAIRSQIDNLSQLVDGWMQKGHIDTLECDLALEKLRALYDALRFGGNAQPVPTEAEPLVAAPEMTTESIDLGEVLSLDELIVTTEHTAPQEVVEQPETTPTTEPEEPIEWEPEAEVEPSAPHSEIEAAIAPQPEAETTKDTEPEEVIEWEPEAEPEPCEVEVEQSAPHSEIEVAPQPAPEEESQREAIDNLTDKADSESLSHQEADSPFIELTITPPSEPAPRHAEVLVATPQTLFGLDNGDAARHRHKQRVIMSLYDSSEPAAPARIQPEPAAAATPRPEPIQPVEVEEDFSIEEIDLTPHAVLGEVINSGVQTLAESLSPQRDQKSDLHRLEVVTDLRRAIGINDKFLMIRDLFDGDGESYELAINELNAFDNLDDCMIHIAENYVWNPNSDGAKLLMELLERKYA